MVPLRLILVIFSIFLFFIISGCKEWRNNPLKQSDTISLSQNNKEKLLEFEVCTAVKKKMSEDITGMGSLVINDKVQVVSRIEGVVEQVFVKKGDSVEKDQVLVKLSNYQLELERFTKEEDVIEAEQELETARIQLVEEEKALYRKFLQIEKLDLQIENFAKEISFMEKNLERKEKLLKKGGTTEEEIRNLNFSIQSKKREALILEKERELVTYGFRDQDLLEAGYPVPKDTEKKRKLLILINTNLPRKRIEFAEIKLRKARVELDRIEWLLGHAEIRSPISGKVAGIKKFAGEKVNQDEPVATVVSLEKLLARVSFSEKDLFNLRNCREVSVHIDSINKKLKAYLYSIDPFIDPDSRSFSVDYLITNSLGLLPGMFIKVSVPEMTQRERILIPTECFIQEEGNKGYVYIVSLNNRIFKREVMGRKISHRYIEVEEGIQENEVVLKSPLINLMDGMQIKVKE